VPFAAVLALALFVTAGFQAATAPADPPLYEGDMTFPYIQDPSGPEEYSWKVQLAKDQALEQIDDQTALVYYVGGHHPALSITAEPAHDAGGTNVPTTLSVATSDVITLTVHHRAGDPNTGGTPFDYPIVAGPGWEGGYQTVIVKGPPDEAELREERERQAREALEAERSRVAPKGCMVPRLKGKSLRASKRRLVRAGCEVGKVTLRGDAKKSQARVVAQTPRPGAALGQAASVNLALG
jgi:hypothetical protein